MVNYDYKDILEEMLNANQVIFEHKDESIPYDFKEKEQLNHAIRAASFYDNNKDKFSKDQRQGIEPFVRGFVDYCFKGNTSITKD